MQTPRVSYAPSPFQTPSRGTHPAFVQPRVYFEAASAPDGKKPKGKRFDMNEFKRPTPWRSLMNALTPFNRFVNLKGLSVLGSWGESLFAGICKIPTVSFPEADQARLAKAVNRNTAAFMGPNHPEFYTDWMIDKEVTSKVAPHLASWATHTIVNLPVVQKFWLWNNLVAQIPNKAGKNDVHPGKEYSIESAMRGDGVLLHPEGTVRWQGDHVGHIFDGIAEMAATTYQRLKAKGENRPVYIAPLVWKLQFDGDASRGLQREMGKVERELGLPQNPKKSVIERFYALQENLLKKQAESFGYTPPANHEALPFFQKQTQLQSFLLENLVPRYETEVPADHGQRLIRISKNIRAAEGQAKAQYREASKLSDAYVAAGSLSPEQTDALATWEQELNLNISGENTLEARVIALKIKAKEQLQQVKEDSRKMTEVFRLEGFHPDVYNGDTLTQEHIAESLKRIQRDLYKSNHPRSPLRNLRNVLSQYVPRPVHPRTAHVRVPEPINVTEWLESKGELSPEALKAELAEMMRVFKSRMQESLDEINREIAPQVKPYSYANPFAVASSRLDREIQQQEMFGLGADTATKAEAQQQPPSSIG
jgi:polyhydroxyalkanoate synthesis regulator phasin